MSLAGLSSYQWELACRSLLRCPIFSQAHRAKLETTQENRAALLAGLDYLLEISFAEDDEASRICLDFWKHFEPDVYSRWATEIMLEYPD